jgi:hypothetical protein
MPSELQVLRAVLGDGIAATAPLVQPVDHLGCPACQWVKIAGRDHLDAQAVSAALLGPRLSN